jgi:lambda family phage portal protein
MSHQADSNIINLQKRRYDAASKTTRTANWLTQGTDATSSIINPEVIRNRARDLVRNNPWAAKGVSVIVNNVVGYGIRAQLKTSTKRGTVRAQDLWKAWAETEQCDAAGLSDFYGIQQTVMRSVVESGECLVRLRPRIAADGLAVNFQLQVMEPDYLYTFNDGPTSSGGYVQRGIEYDALGRRIAYFLYHQHPGNINRYFVSFNTGFSRVPAYEVLHLFRTDRPGQEHGVSWLAPVMIRLRELDIYEDAYLNRQKLANLFAGFINTDDPNDSETEFSDVSELTPGSMYIMKHGRTVDFNKPPDAGDYGPYTLSNLKAIAAGLGITYESLTGDLSQVNFSSARMGWQEFGRSIDGWRWNLIIPRLCKGVARWFSDYASIPDLQTEWTPPSRMMVDPIREIPAIKDAIRAGLMTQSEAIREQGYDPEQLLNEMAADNKRLDELGILLDSDPRKMSNQGQAQSVGRATASSLPDNQPDMSGINSMFDIHT